MNLFSQRSSQKIYIFAKDEVNLYDWLTALRGAGLRISFCNNLDALPLSKNNILLFINPDASFLSELQQNFEIYSKSPENVYIVSDDAAWSDLSLEYSFNLLSYSTHPLEAARIFNHTKKAIARNYFARYASLFNF